MTARRPARAKRGQRAGERPPQDLQLAVDRDAQGLEGARCWVDAAASARPPPPDRGRDHGGEVGGTHEATFLARRQDRLRDAACTAFFTKRRDDSGELSFRGRVDEVEGRETSFFIESHVRRPIRPRS